MDVLVVEQRAPAREMLAAVARKVLAGARVRMVGNLEGAVRELGRAKADFVLLGLPLPGSAGLEAFRRVHERAPQARILIVCDSKVGGLMRAAIIAGAAGFVPADAAKGSKAVESALRLVVEGGTYIPLQALHADFEPAPAMTGRQVEILRLLVRGFGNKEIAKRLNLAENTVEQHLHLVYTAFGVASRAQAVDAALRHGISLE